MPALEKNHIYRSTIEGYSSEGLGVARIAAAATSAIWTTPRSCGPSTSGFRMP